VQAFLDALARHDVDAAMAVTDERVTVTVHPFGIYEKGADVLRSVLADLVRAFPDLMISVSRVIATGDVVTALFKAAGTQTDAYAGAINQEKHLDIDQAWRFAVADGLIAGVDALPSTARPCCWSTWTEPSGPTRTGARTRPRT
jgi:ketosteroid isomerase-like protein